MLEKLRNVSSLRGLSDEQLRDMTALGRMESAPAGHAVFREGDAADCLYIIIDGQVKIERHADAGRDRAALIPLAVLGPGELFGEMALFDGRPRSATVTAVTPAELFRLDRALFSALIEKAPMLTFSLLAASSSRMRAMDEKFVGELLEKQRAREEMEKERYRALAQMVAGVAHEINTPLGIVNTAASLLVESLASDALKSAPLEPDIRCAIDDAIEAARLILGNIERANKLITSFKHLSASQIVQVPEDVDLPSFVQESVELFKPWARRGNLQIEIIDRLPENGRAWHGLPGCLSQLLLNLLSNVERYAYPDGIGGKVEIVLAPGEPPKHAFEISVRDFGRGIAPADLPRVFEPFFTTGRERGGTGLGLAIVQTLVTEALGGAVAIESAPGAGTTVRLELPASLPQAAA